MLSPRRPQLSPITDGDLSAVGDFLATHLNDRVRAEQWADALRVPWQVDAPHHGFQLTVGERIVGVYLAFHSTRIIDDRPERFCNLGAWCVLEEHRGEGLRLLRALLAERGSHFTDLSPSGNVIALNERLRFQHLDTTTSLIPALPWRARRGLRVTSDPDELEVALRGRDLEIFRDHRDAAAAHHVLALREDHYCYVVFRHDRRKSIPGFASLLYVSDPGRFHTVARPLAAHLLRHHRIHSVLAEHRIAGRAPRGAVRLTRARPKMFRSDRLSPEQIDYLYSELACVAW